MLYHHQSNEKGRCHINLCSLSCPPHDSVACRTTFSSSKLKNLKWLFSGWVSHNVVLDSSLYHLLQFIEVFELWVFSLCGVDLLLCLGSLSWHMDQFQYFSIQRCSQLTHWLQGAQVLSVKSICGDMLSLVFFKYVQWTLFLKTCGLFRWPKIPRYQRRVFFSHKTFQISHTVIL